MPSVYTEINQKQKGFSIARVYDTTNTLDLDVLL